MGIAGLLPQLRSITKRGHVSRYRGQRVVVDAYCLLHRGAYTCARELVEGKPTERHVQYCMARISLLTGAGVTPLVVFDGGRLPNKADEERSRERNREENKARARQLWQQGNRAAAMECYQRAVDITPTHAKQFVEALKRRSIQYIVAPFEADAQMAYLALNGLVDAVLTEDSDLLCYGCPTVFFKMDKTGEGEEVQLRDLPQVKELAFQGFGHELFQELCVLAGCDFVDSLPGIGIKKAHQHLRRTRCFLKVVRSLRFDGTKIPEGYEQRVQRALWTFKHQRVYCLRRQAVVHLQEVPGGDLAAGSRVPAAAQLVDGEPDFLGPALPDDVAQAIAVGDLDPVTKQPFSEDLQSATAPLVADAAAGSGSGLSAAGAAGLRAATMGRRQKAGHSGKSGQYMLGAGNGGNTLASYKGFLRGLPKPAAAADFRPPRTSSSQPGSQDSSTAAPHPQEQQVEEDAEATGQERQQQEQKAAPASPQASAQPAANAGDTLASPTEEQWESFRREASRRQRHRGSSKAPVAVTAPAKPDDPNSSSYFAAQPGVPGVRWPGAAQGGLLAHLKAALQPDPTINNLLKAGEEARSPSPSVGDLENCAPWQAEQVAPGGSRSRFVMPHRQRQQVEQEEEQPPKTPLDLGLQPSPTIDDVLTNGMAAGSSSQEDEQLPSLGGDPLLLQPRACLRQWLPQPQPWEQVQQLDLISPAGPACLQQRQLQEQQDEGGITPGFYLGEFSEAGSGARELCSLPCRLPVGTPGSIRPPVMVVQQQQPWDGEATGSEDPIASLNHVAAFEGQAEAAVERAARVALAVAMQKTLRLLPPPPHLQARGGATSVSPASAADSDGGSGARQKQASALLVAKRPLLGLAGRVAPEKENQQALQADGSKRLKSSRLLAANPFSSFAFPVKS